VSAGQFALLAQRRFAPFFLTQFLGAANDNVFKFSFTLLITYQGGLPAGMSAIAGANAIAVCFILPFLLVSATSGQLADRYDKGAIMRGVKLLELAIMAVGALGFLRHDFPILLACTFLMGVHSAIFGPAKYSYLPQHLGEREIVAGNGLVETGTFVAILAGTLLGGFLMDQGADSARLAATTCVLLALAGLAASLAIPRTPGTEPELRIDWNPVRVLFANLAIARERRAVFLSMLGISWLWFFGVIFLTQFPAFARDVLGGGPLIANLLLAMFTVGVATGSLACDRLSRHIVEIGLVPLGSIGMTVFGVDLALAVPTHPLGTLQGAGEFLAHREHWRVLADLFLLSVSAGLYSVPLYALIQTRCPEGHRSRIIAANNILNALFMVVAAGWTMGVLALPGAGIIELFLATAILNAAVAIFIYLQVPEFLFRFLAWVVVGAAYHVRASGRHHIPARGAALIVANHVSYVDALVLSAASPRPIRFVMDRGIFRIPVLSWLFRQVKVIPIAPAKVDPAMMERAFDLVSEQLREGELVCIFPEGGLTRDGEIARFRPGVSRILERDPVPVVPIALQGLWGSLFSHQKGTFRTRRGLFFRVGLVVGEPVPASQATPETLQRIVQGLRGDAR
jgi:1-acyl-sn-glycerol-3-phosphate acyltransferase